MTLPALLYNGPLDQETRQRLNLESSQVSFSDEDFLDFVLGQHRKDPKFPTEAFPRAEYFFYLLMQIGRRRPHLFPTPDLCLAIFNILAARHNLAASRLVCLDLGLLPVAVLAAGQGARVAPPPAASSAALWPDWLFPATRTNDRGWAGAFILGRDPLKLTKEDPDLPGKMAEASGGLLFCYWDFLGVNLHNHARKKWLDAGAIRSIIQLPRPRRQTATYYPAIIETGSVRPGHVRLADVREISPGPGGLSQKEVLQVILDTPDREKSVDVPAKALLQKDRADFTPRRYLVNQHAPQEAPLSEYARLLRCQLLRTKLTPEEIKEAAQEAGGRSNDGSFLCREVTLPNLDERTGFLLPGAGAMVKVREFYYAGRNEEHLLRENDILISFRGTEANIGQVGLMDDPPGESMITGQSLLIIRTFKNSIDPIWLYYYLRREKTRQQVLSHSSGSKALTVNTGDLAQLAVPKPTSAQVEACRERHNQIRSLMNQVRNLYAQIQEKLDNNLG